MSEEDPLKLEALAYMLFEVAYRSMEADPSHQGADGDTPTAPEHIWRAMTAEEHNACRSNARLFMKNAEHAGLKVSLRSKVKNRKFLRELTTIPARPAYTIPELELENEQ